MIDAMSAWDWPRGAEAKRIDVGLINTTWKVELDGEPIAVLQRLNTSIFRPQVHHDLHAISQHVLARGLASPELRPTRSGALWHDAPDGVWRVLSWVGDRTIEKVESLADAESAGELVGRFHKATADFRGDFQSIRGAFHDTEAHLRALEDAVQRFSEHRHHDEMRELLDTATAMYASLPSAGELPKQVVHGDLKLSNIRFDGPDAVALIDLDTLAYGTLDAELGDALRSWCNPRREDQPPTVDMDVFRAAMRGYHRSVPDLSAAARTGVVAGFERIPLELSVRFATDVLAECYFGWDASRYPSRSDHNLARARSQLALAQLVSQHRQELADAMGEIWASAAT